MSWKRILSRRNHLQTNLCDFEPFPASIGAENANLTPTPTDTQTKAETLMATVNWTCKLIALQKNLPFKADKNTIQIFSENGRNYHVLSLNRVVALARNFKARTGKMDTFFKELTLLTARYFSNDDRILRITPPFIYETLCKFFEINTDYQTTPLNFHHQTPRYCSKDKRDWVFGATLISSNSPWTRNGFATPDYNDQDITHCCLKSLEAAEKMNKTFFLLLPEWEERNFSKLLQGPLVRKVALWQENTFKFSTPSNRVSCLFKSRICLYMISKDQRKFPVEFLAELQHRSIKEMGSSPTIFNKSTMGTIERIIKNHTPTREQ